MLISTKELRTYLQGLEQKLRASMSEENFPAGMYVQSLFLADIARWEQKQFEECPDLPYAMGSDQEHALLIYCTPKLYEFVDKFEDMQKEDKDISLLDIGKLWLEVKKFLKEGRFKRV